MAILYFVWIACFKSATLKKKWEEKMMLSDYLCLILCISLRDSGDLSVSKQNIFKRNIFILHNYIFLSFISAVMCGILGIQLISYQLKENSFCIADKSLAIFFPRSVSMLKFWIRPHQAFRVTTVKVIIVFLEFILYDQTADLLKPYMSRLSTLHYSQPNHNST